MRIIHNIKEMQRLSARWQREVKTVGFVPTMGALHKGHLSLIQRARQETQIVVVSIFVNPAQFGPNEDYRRYPRPHHRDIQLGRQMGVNVLFKPSVKDTFRVRYQSWVEVVPLSERLCGPFRPGHFRGVATVVTKLFQMIQPTKAYFGEKDFQQLRIVQKLVSDLNMPIDIVACPTIREPDGLAVSSRNYYLTPQQRYWAPLLYQSLQLGRDMIKLQHLPSARKVIHLMRQTLHRIPRARIDYISIVDPETLLPIRKCQSPLLLAVAICIGKIRLIDNLLVT